MTRFICIDFETVGWKRENEIIPLEYWPKPCFNFPIQISVDAVEPDLFVTHVFDGLIVGGVQAARMPSETVLPHLGLRPGHLEEDLKARGTPLHRVLRDLAELLTPGAVLVSHNMVYDIGEVLCVNWPKLTARPHFDDVEQILQKILAAPRLCTKIWKRCAMPKLQEMYDVQNERAHDARGDSKALAHCLAKALRRHEKPPICYVPLDLELFQGKFWRKHEHWIDRTVVERGSITVETRSMDLRVALARGSAVVEVADDRVTARVTDDPNDCG